MRRELRPPPAHDRAADGERDGRRHQRQRERTRAGALARGQAAQEVEVTDHRREAGRVEPPHREPDAPRRGRVEERSERRIAAIGDRGSRIEQRGGKMHDCAQPRSVAVRRFKRKPPGRDGDHRQPVTGARVDPSRQPCSTAEPEQQPGRSERESIPRQARVRGVRHADERGADGSEEYDRQLEAALARRVQRQERHAAEQRERQEHVRLRRVCGFSAERGDHGARRDRHTRRCTRAPGDDGTISPARWQMTGNPLREARVHRRTERDGRRQRREREVLGAHVERIDDAHRDAEHGRHGAGAGNRAGLRQLLSAHGGHNGVEGGEHAEQSRKQPA